MVKVGCPVHGEFEITPEHHRRGVGCRLCYFESQRTSKAEFVSRSRQHFGDLYGYDLFEDLPRVGEKVAILCRKHDKIFWQEPRSHMRGHTGCTKCKSAKLAGPRDKRGTIKSEEELRQDFRGRAELVHGSEYDYSQFEYTGSSVSGKIICARHGEFWQTPSNHLRGTKCPDCSRERRRATTFKGKCKELGIDYWRTLKRREAGMPEVKIFDEDYIRHLREINEVTVAGVSYPNLEEAVRHLKPPASSHTIGRWLAEGLTPEEAFGRIPNPGYANGIIYVVSHKATGKRYVGLTIQTLDRRWKMHVEQASSGCIKGAESLHAAIREFGPDAFEIVQVDQGTTKRDLEAKERFWIKNLATLVPEGYNISRGGVSGGSTRKPTVVDEVLFESVGSAAEYVSKTRRISVEAAKRRLLHKRVDVKTPARPGTSLVKTKAYKAWSRIVHGALNPKSREYIPGVRIHEPWRDFVTFYRDVGNPPEQGMAFTRLEKSGGFFPGNCIWLSKSEASKINAEHMKQTGTLVGRRGLPVPRKKHRKSTT